MGTFELAIPKVKPQDLFPSLLQPRRRAEHALLAVATPRLDTHEAATLLLRGSR